MPTVTLTKALEAEYVRLFDTCNINAGRLAEVDNLVAKIAENQERYQAVADAVKIPWHFISAVHCLEASLSFKKHLHNGDPLTARTVHVPAGRPLSGNPPFTWEASAEDSLRLKKLDQVAAWTLPVLLFQLERYNGFGYRTQHPDVLTPYLWSYSGHYTKGKYVADGTFDPDAVSKQCGSAVLLRRMAEKGIITFDELGNPHMTPTPTPDEAAPMVTFSETQESEAARKLQHALNQLPGIFLLEDGVPGRKTSDAFRKATGHFLQGDPRAVAGAHA